MIRVVVLVFGKDGVCFPSGPSNRVLLDGACPPALQPAAASVCQAIADVGLRPTTMETLPQDGCFAMVILAEMDGINVEAVRQALLQKGQALGLTLRVQREDVFRAMHRI